MALAAPSPPGGHLLRRLPLVKRAASVSVAMKQDEEDTPMADMISEWRNQATSEELNRYLGNGEDRPAKGFGKKKPKPLPPEAQQRIRMINKLTNRLSKLSEPAMRRALIPPELLPAEEALPSEVFLGGLTGQRDDVNFSIPMESSLVALEDKKRPGMVYKSLSLQPNIENPEAVENKVAGILNRKIPAWFLNGNKWFGSGRLRFPETRTHFTVTNRREDLTEVGRSFLDDLDRKVLEGHVPQSRQVRLYFTPQQLKLVPIIRSWKFWNDTDPCEKEVAVARILLLGDILVVDSKPFEELADQLNDDDFDDLLLRLNSSLEDLDSQDVDDMSGDFSEQDGYLWKQPFDRDENWSPHLTILTVSVERKALVKGLKRGWACRRFNRELMRRAQTVNNGVLFEGQAKCWPFVSAVMGQGGTRFMNQVDREVEQFKAGFIGDAFRDSMEPRSNTRKRRSSRKRKR